MPHTPSKRNEKFFFSQFMFIIQWISNFPFHKPHEIFLVLPNTRTLHITNIIVPPFVDVRDVVTLSCSYNIGTQKLNSVKWYKNDKEFYRWEKDVFCIFFFAVCMADDDIATLSHGFYNFAFCYQLTANMHIAYIFQS